MDVNKDVDEISSLTQKDRQDILDTFRKSGSHERKYPSLPVFAVLTYEDKGRKVAVRSRNTKKYHAEINMLSYLRAGPGKRWFCNETVKLYISLSPCRACSMALVAFLVQAETRSQTIKMEVIFTHLYKINRPSCREGRHVRDHSPSNANDHDLNLKGLLTLLDRGVQLRTFEMKDWQRLSSALGVPMIPYTLSNARRQEDDELRRDWQILVGSVSVPIIWPQERGNGWEGENRSCYLDIPSDEEEEEEEEMEDFAAEQPFIKPAQRGNAVLSQNSSRKSSCCDSCTIL